MKTKRQTIREFEANIEKAEMKALGKTSQKRKLTEREQKRMLELARKYGFLRMIA
jgi:hypothetical protein